MRFKVMTAVVILVMSFIYNCNTVSASDVNSQLNNLYNQIATSLDMKSEHIKIIQALCDNKVIYPDLEADIYKDTMVQDVIFGDCDIICADFVEYDYIDRPSSKFLPDSLYSIAYNIKDIMEERYDYNRGGIQIHFDSLSDDAKENLIFYESVLIYLGEDVANVDKLYSIYEKILCNKSNDENIVRIDTSGNIVLKGKFRRYFNNTFKDESINKLAILLSYDESMAKNDNIENIKDTYTMPYKLNLYTKENMMIAAMSLCGKVRYVWGGGHSGASYIDGINPLWIEFNNLYEDSSTCIKPSSSNCPIHGDIDCSFYDKIYSLEDFIKLRSDVYDKNILTSNKYKELLNTVIYDNGVSAHALDGLDCSGYASWVYNQVISDYNINSTAVNFIQQKGIEEVPFSSDLLPGDLFTWTTHIVVVVGKVDDNSRAYVTIEQTPNVLKFGVIHYNNASRSDIDLAKNIAREANILLGNIDEEPHVYCMNNVGKYTETINVDELEQYVNNTELLIEKPKPAEPEEVTNEEVIVDTASIEVDIHTMNDSDLTTLEEVETVEIEKQYMAIGRLSDEFLDSEVIIEEYGKTLDDMSAIEIIQHTISKLPMTYISGYNVYTGKLFDKDLASCNVGIYSQER